MAEVGQIEQLEHQLEQTKFLKARKEMAERLWRNPDFRTLIVDGFMRDDAARFVQESGDPSLNAESRADALGLAQASGHLKRFLSMQIQMANAAERNITDIEEALAELRAEEAEVEVEAN